MTDQPTDPQAPIDDSASASKPRGNLPSADKMPTASPTSRFADRDANEAVEVELDETKLEAFLDEARWQQNLGLGIAAGLGVAVVCAVIWAAVTAATGYQIGFMALGVGFAVGWTVRVVGKGIDPTFRYAGAGLSLLGCMLGNLFATYMLIAQELSISVTEVFQTVEVGLVVDAAIEMSSGMDLLFYGIAAYEGYQFAARVLSPSEIRALKKK